MKIYKRLASLAVASAVAISAMAQNSNSSYFMESMANRHEINPAFTPDYNYVSPLPALGGMLIGSNSNIGVSDFLFKHNGQLVTGLNQAISADEFLSGLKNGANLDLNMKLNILSFGFKKWGGYNTFGLSVHSTTGITLPYELFEFAKNTGNKTYDMGDVNAHAMSYAELALGHSRQINEKLRVGAKLKFLFGLGRADLKLQNLKADLAGENKWTVSGQAVADVSMKGFTYLSTTDEYNNPDNGTYDKIDDVDVDGFGLGGFGMAVDLGAVYQIDDDWRVSASVLDLGFISWSENAQAVNRSDEFVFDGFHDISVNDGVGVPFEDQTDNYGDQITDFINLRDNGNKGGRTTGIGATLNFGAEYNLPVYRKITFGLLSSTRIKGAYTWTEGRLSANWTPLKWLDGGVNFAVNSFTASMGWVLNIHPKGYNFFIGMDHLLGKTSKEFIPLSSNASLNLGMSITW